MTYAAKKFGSLHWAEEVEKPPDAVTAWRTLALLGFDDKVRWEIESRWFAALLERVPEEERPVFPPDTAGWWRKVMPRWTEPEARDLLERIARGVIPPEDRAGPLDWNPQNSEDLTMALVARKRLTLKFLKSLPDGVYVISNVGYQPSPKSRPVPLFVEPVAGQGSRRDQWARIKNAGADGRLCQVVDSAKDLEAFGLPSDSSLAN